MNKYIFIIGVHNVEQQHCGIIVDIFAQKSCVGELCLLAGNLSGHGGSISSLLGCGSLTI